MQVCQWVFGQEFPGPDAPLGQQLLSVGTAMVGLATFAMVLALVEQVVLELLEANVKRGSKVFEAGHVSTNKQTCTRYFAQAPQHVLCRCLTHSCTDDAR